jgi:hypothetical protein
MGRSEDVSDELWMNGPWEQVHHSRTATLAKVRSYTSGSSGDKLRQDCNQCLGTWPSSCRVTSKTTELHPPQSDTLLRSNYPQRLSVIRQAKTDTRMVTWKWGAWVDEPFLSEVAVGNRITKR